MIVFLNINGRARKIIVGGVVWVWTPPYGWRSESGTTGLEGVVLLRSYMMALVHSGTGGS